MLQKDHVKPRGLCLPDAPSTVGLVKNCEGSASQNLRGPKSQLYLNQSVDVYMCGTYRIHIN